jgi:hypothetical protein
VAPSLAREPVQRLHEVEDHERGGTVSEVKDLRSGLNCKIARNFDPPRKPPSALISLQKIKLGGSSFASNRDPTQEVDS